ncbi:hypothetical protein GWO43_23305 [candidate division KSB1 bacterium]|nr:hypothetical protein [candidate division KSB1 bacterium]NIR73010.1 hypothetical protein [candidate division KSB1 bacterium]NIS26914.1 hypothetical protein [candidate division KSB1 bacterium]NIT73747.1 hypothetical protein [candidate division KSB1 bacterium]NIU27652.1 hypothetical protein [candidate division KSB1 bacterium]
MIDFMEQILTNFESGHISRREAVVRLASLVLGVVGTSNIANTQHSGSPTFQAKGLNHLGLRVSNISLSRDFYREHLGLTVIRDNTPHNCFMACGDNYVGLFRSDNPRMDHCCYTVEAYDPDSATQKLKKAGIDSRREENRVYFEDPDDLTIQLSGKWDSWPGTPPVQR